MSGGVLESCVREGEGRAWGTREHGRRERERESEKERERERGRERESDRQSVRTRAMESNNTCDVGARSCSTMHSAFVLSNFNLLRPPRQRVVEGKGWRATGLKAGSEGKGKE
eukprot:2387406-Rhodomonas_salina.2